MNKNIKRIMASVVALNTITALVPSTSLNTLFLCKAYADDNIYLKGISVSDADPIQVSSSKKTYKTAVPNSTESVTIRVSVNNKKDKVTINGEAAEKASNNDKRYTSKVELEKGNNEVEITVESDDGDKERTYTLKIDRGGKQSTDSESVALDNIKLSEGSIDFDKDTTEYNCSVNEDVSEITIEAKPEKAGTKVFIDGSKVNKDEKYEKYRRDVKLTKGSNTILIELEDEDDDDNTKTYTLNIYRGKNKNSKNENSESNKYDNTQDEIYLDNIKLNDGDCKISPKFNKKITSYTANVGEDVDSIIVKGENENDSNIIKINGITADSKNRKRISLTPGKNEIEVRVNTDCDSDSKDYKKRVYKLTVYRGDSENSNSNTKANEEKKVEENSTNNSNAVTNNVTTNNNSSDKVNKWVNVKGKWQYNDATGNPIKNIWFNDRNDGKTYYLDKDGNMFTGWLPYNNEWYYLDLSGSMQIGWKQIDGDWYYFNADGKMKTGWLENSDGKYYYFYTSGKMACNTVVNGYKIDSNGCWVK